MTITLEDIKNYVESKTELDLSKNCRKRSLVDARALYFKLARKHTNESYDAIGSLVNRDHSSVVHSVKHSFEIVYKFNPFIKMLYNDFNPIVWADKDSFSEEEVNDILTENIMLKDKLATLQSSYSRVVEIAKDVPEEKMEEFLTKMSAVASMIKSVYDYEKSIQRSA
jgi:hypothetical protein